MASNIFRRAPKAVMPIATKSLSLMEENVGKSISCEVNSPIYLSSPREARRLDMSGHFDEVIRFTMLVDVWSKKLLLFMLAFTGDVSVMSKLSLALGEFHISSI